jgi:thiamine kinase-like enzyme
VRGLPCPGHGWKVYVAVLLNGGALTGSGELDDIVAGLAVSLGAAEGAPRPLSGGITNRNWRVRLGGGEYVLRRHGRDTDLLGIDREAERLALERAAALGVAPELVARLPDGLVTRWVPCEELGGTELRERAGELAASLRAFHESGLRLPSAFWVPDLLREYAAVLQRRGAAVPAEYDSAAALAARIARALPAREPRPCHNDLLPGNLIRARADGRIMIVDWEYAGMGHPYFDLGNLAVNNDFGDADEARLLAGYHARGPTDGERAALKLMRMLSDAREGAWGVVQSVVSELDFDFAGYAAQHFGRLRAAAQQADFEEWLAAA